MSFCPFMAACIALAGKNKHVEAIMLHEFARKIISGKAKTVRFRDTDRRAIRRSQQYLSADFGFSRDQVKDAIRHLRNVGTIETDNGEHGGKITTIALTEHCEKILRGALTRGTEGKSAPATKGKSAPAPGAYKHAEGGEIATPESDESEEEEGTGIQSSNQSTAGPSESEKSGEGKDWSEDVQRVWKAFSRGREEAGLEIQTLSDKRKEFCARLVEQHGDHAAAYVRVLCKQWEEYRAAVLAANKHVVILTTPDLGNMTYAPDTVRDFCAKSLYLKRYAKDPLADKASIGFKQLGETS